MDRIAVANMLRKHLTTHCTYNGSTSGFGLSFKPSEKPQLVGRDLDELEEFAKGLGVTSFVVALPGPGGSATNPAVRQASVTIAARRVPIFVDRNGVLQVAHPEQLTAQELAFATEVV